MISLFLPLLLGACAQEPSPAVLLRAYSHNDYLQARPLLDALDRGFFGVEADVHLKDGELLIGHEAGDLKAGVTLKKLYLDPLLARARATGGKIHPGGPKGFLLMVEFKSDGDASYRVLREQLKDYEEMLTVFTDDAVEERAITILISGKRPERLLLEEPARPAALDGNFGDFDRTEKTLFPVISDYWWKILGPKGTLDRIALARLKHFAQRAHDRGRQIRFYGAPNAEWSWRLLYEAGIDRINADDLEGLRKFLLSREPRPIDRAENAVGLIAAPL